MTGCGKLVIPGGGAGEEEAEVTCPEGEAFGDAFDQRWPLFGEPAFATVFGEAEEEGDMAAFWCT